MPRGAAGVARAGDPRQTPSVCAPAACIRGLASAPVYLTRHAAAALALAQQYERPLIESWLEQHDTSPCSGAVLSSKALVPNSVLKAAIEEYGQITQEKARIEEAKRQLLEHQRFVLRRENELRQVMQAQRTLQIAQARQEADRLQLDVNHGGELVVAASGGAAQSHEQMLAAEGRRRAEAEKEKETQQQRIHELLAAEEEERKREYERQERELKLQVRAGSIPSGRLCSVCRLCSLSEGVLRTILFYQDWIHYGRKPY